MNCKNAENFLDKVHGCWYGKCLGGAAGALLAMRVARHKTKHWYFWALNILGLVWQLTLLGFLFISK